MMDHTSTFEIKFIIIKSHNKLLLLSYSRITDKVWTVVSAGYPALLFQLIV